MEVATGGHKWKGSDCGMRLLTCVQGISKDCDGKTWTFLEEHLLHNTNMIFSTLEKLERKHLTTTTILRKPSVKAQQRKRKLATLSDKKPTRNHLSKVEQDLKLVQKCFHKKLKWSLKTQKPVDLIAEQYIPLPLTIADNDGMPIKG